METNGIKRKPGRPPGSTRLREPDAALLERVADKLLARPHISTRAAILQVLGKPDPTALRRLQGKFQPKETFMAAALERADAAMRQTAMTTAEAVRQAVESLTFSDDVRQALATLATVGGPSPLMREVQQAVQAVRKLAVSMPDLKEWTILQEQLRTAHANFRPVQLGALIDLAPYLPPKLKRA